MTVEDRYFVQGTRLAVLYELDQTTGLIDVTGTTPTTPNYGHVWYGPKAFTGNFPAPRIITHTGQDRPLQITFLPALEGMSGELNVSAHETDIITTAMGVLAETLGTAKLVPAFSSQQGFEPVVGLWLARSAESITGLQRWQSYIFSAAKCIWMPGSFTDGAGELTYQIAPKISTQKLWGEDWSDSLNGVEYAQMGVLATVGYPYLCAWEGDTGATEYNFDANKPANDSSTAFLGAWQNGTPLAISTDYTAATDGITLAAEPTTGDVIVCLYEGPAQVRT